MSNRPGPSAASTTAEQRRVKRELDRANRKAKSELEREMRRVSRRADHAATAPPPDVQPDQAPRVDDQERARREHDVRAIRHSTVMEGGSVTPETMALQDAWVRGEITGDQMVDAVRRRYGLTDSE